MAIAVTSSNFQTEVINSKIPVLVDFWAEWCGPCKLLAPIIDEVATDYEGKIKICKINVEEAGELASQFGIMNIPTVLLFKNGKIMEKKIGAMAKREVEELVGNYLVR